MNRSFYHPQEVPSFANQTNAQANHFTHGPDTNGLDLNQDRASMQDFAQLQSKKGSAVEFYFKGRKFTGAPEQSINNLIRDFEICADQQSLNPAQMSLFFVNALADPARQFFLTNCSTHMEIDEITKVMSRHYNSETRKLQLQSEMDSLDLSSFMHERQITDNSLG